LICKLLILNISVFYRPIATAMKLKNAYPEIVVECFILKTKYLQLILTLSIKSFIKNRERA